MALGGSSRAEGLGGGVGGEAWAREPCRSVARPGSHPSYLATWRPSYPPTQRASDPPTDAATCPPECGGKMSGFNEGFIQ
jgi:hypothetical protein